jgi:hypothetical protein
VSTTAALAAFSEALAALGIHPDDVEVSLSVSDWKALDRQLAKEHADGLFEGVGVTGEVTVKGVRYVVSFG